MRFQPFADHCGPRPKGADYVAAFGNPCASKGAGAIPDAAAGGRIKLENALGLAKQVLAEQNIGKAKQIASKGHGERTHGVELRRSLAASPASATCLAETLFGLIGWRHAFGDVTPTAAFAFAGGQPFGIAAVPITRDAAALEAGADMRIARSAHVGVYYSGQMGSRFQDNGVKAFVSWRF